MGAVTDIAWTDRTYNPVWGCTRVSPGCANCYAETMARRWGWNIWGRTADRRTFGDKHWMEPLVWNSEAEKTGTGTKVFCASMCDIFESHATTRATLPRLFDLIRKTPLLTWQLLTKRPERIADSLPADWGRGYPNVWLGTTIESNEQADRVKALTRNPAVCHFVSNEPALGPLDIDLSHVEWVIHGGESGAHFREADPKWAETLHDRCKEKGVAYFYKQPSGRFPGGKALIRGRVVKNFPKL